MPSFVWWLRDWNTVFRWMPYSWTAFQCIPDNEEPRPSKPSVLPYSGKQFDKSHTRCGHPYSLNLFFLYCSSLYYYWTVFCLFYGKNSVRLIQCFRWIFNVYPVWKTCSLTFTGDQIFFLQSIQCGFDRHFTLVHGFCQALDGEENEHMTLFICPSVIFLGQPCSVEQNRIENFCSFI